MRLRVRNRHVLAKCTTARCGTRADSRATVVRPTVNPLPYKPFTSWDSDFVVHRNGEHGSPRMPGSTNSSSAASIPGWTSSTGRRPAPGARTRPSGCTPARISATPAYTVVREAPDSRATNPIPTQPIASASDPRYNRHCFSSRCGRIAANFSVNAASATTRVQRTTSHSGTTTM